MGPNSPHLVNELPTLSMTRTLAHYDVCEQIGEGTYGQVYRGVCKDSGQTVALKRMQRLHGQEGLPTQLVREIKILKCLHHVNLLELREVVTSKGVEHLDPDDPPQAKHKSKAAPLDKTAIAREKYKGTLFLVLEYVSHDLTGLIDIQYKFTEVQIKCIFRQLLAALQHMHSHKYVHRDIKSSNILLDNNFRLKLADFGLARSVEPPLLDYVEDHRSTTSTSGVYTNKVITLWYRPPEILLGAVQYGPAVDIWSAGCILAELWQGKPLFVGKTEMEQWKAVLDVLGTPTLETWNQLNANLPKSINALNVSLPHEQLQPLWQTKYAAKLPSRAALALLMRLLEWDPRQRLTASQAMQHRYFSSDPVTPLDPAELGCVLENPGSQLHEFQTKAKRKQAKAEAEQARERAVNKGASPSQAQRRYDEVYLKLMEKVAAAGFEQKTVTRRSAAEAANPNFERDQQRKDSERRRTEERDRNKTDSSRRDAHDRQRSRSRDKRNKRRKEERDGKHGRSRDQRRYEGRKNNREEKNDNGKRPEHRRDDRERDFGSQHRESGGHRQHRRDDMVDALYHDSHRDRDDSSRRRMSNERDGHGGGKRREMGRNLNHGSYGPSSDGMRRPPRDGSHYHDDRSRTSFDQVAYDSGRFRGTDGREERPPHHSRMSEPGWREPRDCRDVEGGRNRSYRDDDRKREYEDAEFDRHRRRDDDHHDRRERHHDRRHEMLDERDRRIGSDGPHREYDRRRMDDRSTRSRGPNSFSGRP